MGNTHIHTHISSYISICMCTPESTKQKPNEVQQGSRREKCKFNEVSKSKVKPDANLMRFENEDKMRFQNPIQIY